MRTYVRVGEATILHADLDAFYASVEQRDDPRLRGRPVIVGAGVVLAASYEAKAYGVRTAMGGGQARRLCPHAVVVSPRMSAYSEASKAVFEVFDDTTPLVEGLSIDEAFLDVRGLRADRRHAAEIAVRLRREVRERVGLPITVGVARTKFLAKVASGVAKPDGLLVVPPDGELAFLHPLPVERLWGVGPVTARKLHERGHRDGRRGRAARRGRARRRCSAAASGRHLHALAHNRDPRPVQVGRRRRSIGAQRALGRAPPVARRDRRRPRRRSSTASRGGCAPPGASAARSCCACASTTSRARRARTRSREATARHARDPRGGARAARGARAADRAAGPHARRRSRSANLENDDAVQLALPFDAAAARARRRARRGARPVRLGGGHAGGAARPRPGARDAAAARLNVAGGDRDATRARARARPGRRRLRAARSCSATAPAAASQRPISSPRSPPRTRPGSRRCSSSSPTASRVGARPPPRISSTRRGPRSVAHLARRRASRRAARRRRPLLRRARRVPHRGGDRRRRRSLPRVPAASRRAAGRAPSGRAGFPSSTP